MAWSMALNLLPEEWVVEEGDSKPRYGVTPEHTPILTNQRLLVRYNTLSTGLIKSFNYGDISEIVAEARFRIKYLKITAAGRVHYLAVDDPDEWSARITACLGRFMNGGFERPREAVRTPQEPPARTDPDLVSYIDRLYAAGILTGQEHSAKRRMLAGEP